MINIKNLTIKNFMSVGNVSQAINFNGHDLVLILGENLDQGGNDSRNGVGKSAILHAISYALYGKGFVVMNVGNLVNKINKKEMVVTLEFEKDSVKYRIERGRKPNFLKFIVNGKEYGDDDTDEAQGDSRETQAEISRVLNFNHEVFKQIVGMNTDSTPFLKLGSGDQRSLIEQLLGITKLSEKADILQAQLKTVKDDIKEEELLINAKKSANKTIEDNIKRIERSSKLWEKTKEETLNDLTVSLNKLQELDIEQELESHRLNEVRKERLQEFNELKKEKSALEKEIKLYQKTLKLALTSIESIEQKFCPTCGQEMDSDTHNKVHNDFETQVNEAKEKIKEKSDLLEELNVKIDHHTMPGEYITFYSKVNEAYEHKSSIESIEKELEKERKSENPYTDQITSLRENGIEEIDYTHMNELTSLRDHQEFLFKLLTNKESFIRKKIIDQNLLYLNNRLKEYTQAVGLPHNVKFYPDLEVEITELGQEYDFGNLSKGERTRLILSLSWAFRDVYESIHDKINLLFIDELIDSGLDSNGAESALRVLKQMTREQKRNIFLISHKDELVGRVSNVMKVVKENNFTSFDITDTNVI